ncbi:MAG TPA: hypothetical protein VK175_18555 [Leadbetterella sp.]|nr:hypothetical protein [Leadbetterella sp.]
MKDWENISDDEFDEVFRANAQNHEELWPDAWPLMEEKLEDENRKRRFIVFWRWAAAVLIFGTIGILTIGYFRTSGVENQSAKLHQGIPQKSQKKGNLEKNNPVLKSNKPLQSPNKQDANGPSQPTDKIEVGLKLSKATQKNLDKNNTKFKPKNVSQKPEIKNIDNENLAQVIKADDKPKKEESVLSKSPVNSVYEQEAPLTEPLLSQTKIEVETKTNESYFSKDTVIILTNENNPILAQNEVNDLSEASNQSTPKLFQKLAFNLGFSPDYSKVVSSEFGPLGYNLQILLDYKITQRLTFRGGLIKSLKLYDAYPENYAWPAKWGTPSSPLKEISASCNMLDIPISLSYNVLEKGPNKFFSTLGITNYKMLKEKYEYTYENNYDPNLKWKKWEGNSGFFGAGVVNFSLGVERRLTQFLSIQVEPFVKIPIKRVGFGDVKLLSTGLFFNLKTHFPSKVQQPK